jgi:hypothetical protein
MSRSQRTLRRMVAGFLTLALVVTALTVFVGPAAAAGGLETFVSQSGDHRITTVINHDNGQIVQQVSNRKTGTTRTTSTYADGSTKTVVSSGGGTTVLCTGPDGKEVACP